MCVHGEDRIRGNNDEKEGMCGDHAKSPTAFSPERGLPSDQGPAYSYREK